jgi:hypothetical protein
MARPPLLAALAALVAAGLCHGAAGLRPGGAGPAPAAAVPEDPQDQEARKVFDSLYAKDLERVAGTRDLKDDQQLAERLLAAAKTAGQHPRLVALLCTTASELAVPYRTAHPLALDAADFLYSQHPDLAAPAQEQVLPLRERLYTYARGKERQEKGEALVDALACVADRKVAAGDFTEAAGLYHRAITTARAIRSAKQTEIEAKAKDLVRLRQVAQEVERLKAVVAGQPDDAAARNDLVRLLVVEKDDPAQALQYLAPACEERLAKYVPAAAKGVEAAPELACMELGDWYRDLGEAAPGRARTAMFIRAAAYYQRFLELHTGEDLKQAQAKLALEKMNEALKRLGVAVAAKGGPAGATAVDLLKVADPARDTVAGQWQRGAGGLSVASSKAARLHFPITAEGDYNLRVGFWRAAEGPVVVGLPVGKTGVCLVLGLEGKSGLSRVNRRDATNNETTVPAGRLAVGRESTLDVTVTAQGEQVSIQVALDDKPYLGWQGPMAALSPDSFWSGIGDGGFGFGAHEVAAAVRGAQLKMLSGRAWATREMPGIQEKPAQEPAFTDRPRTARDGLEVSFHGLPWNGRAADLINVAPYGSGVAKQVYYPSSRDPVPEANRSQNVGVIFTGFLNVPTDGEYVLAITSDDDSVVYLDNAKLVESGGNMLAEESGRAKLKAGWHTLRILYRNGAGSGGVILRYQGPGLDKQVVPAAAFCHIPGAK